LAPETYRTVEDHNRKRAPILSRRIRARKATGWKAGFSNKCSCRMPDLKVKVKTHPIWAVVAMIAAFAVLALIIVVGA
jgi:hypothetical protein